MKRVSAVRIGELANAMKGSFDKPIGTPKHWINWGIGWLAKNPQVLVEVLRPQSIVEWLGKLYEDVSTDESLQRSVISTIEQILPLWLDGAPLVQIEKVIRPKKPTIKCDAARDWAIKIAPELAYFFSANSDLQTSERR